MPRKPQQHRHHPSESSGPLLSPLMRNVGCGILLAALVLGIAYVRSRILKVPDHPSPSTPAPNSSRATGSSEALRPVQSSLTVVFDRVQGKPDRVFKCFKQVHFGPSFLDSIRRDPEGNKGRVSLFIRHQANLRAQLDNLRESAPLNQVHFFFEGYAGDEGPGSPQELFSYPDMLSSFFQMNRVLRDQALFQNAYALLTEKLHSLDPDAQQFALMMLRCAPRFIAACGPSRASILHGADPKGHPALVRWYHDKIAELRKRGNPSDSDLAQFLKDLQEKTQQDQKLRHRYLSALMAEKVPLGGTGVLILGGSHFSAGFPFQRKPTEDPFEGHLHAVQNSRTIVYDEPNAVALNSSLEKGHNVLQIDGDSSVADMREYLRRTQ